MMRPGVAAIIISLVLSAGVPAENQAEKNFSELAAEIIENLQAFWPVAATYMGVHTNDDRFADYSSKSVDSERRKLRKFLARLYKYQTVKLPVDMHIDRRLLKANCESALLRLWEIGYHRLNPNLYIDDATNGIYYILLRDYLPLDQRLDHIIGRMRALPAYLQQGENNLNDPPSIWLAYARENIDNAISFYRMVTAELAAQFPHRAEELNDASRQAVDGLEKFGDFLATLPEGEPGSYAIGKEYFDYVLEHGYFYDFDADSLLRIGEKLLAETQATYREFRAKLEAAGDAEPPPVFIPSSITRQDVLDYYNWEINAVRQYVSEHDLLTIPEDVGECIVVEVPEFMRGVFHGGAYIPAGPFDQATTGYFYVSPVPENMTEAERQEYYRRIRNREFRGLVVHEVYPGHHLQLQLAARVGSDVRKWQVNNALAEGWALYCEEMMYDAGLYANQPERYLRVLKGILFRAARIIVDVKLHTGQFDFDQAVAWMSETLESDTAVMKREVLRYSMDPGQPMSYLMGKREIMALRDEVAALEGNAFDLKSFHDRFLSEGTIPISLVREKMLK